MIEILLDLVKEDKVDVALELLMGQLTENDKEAYLHATLICNRLSRLEKKKSLNIVSEQEMTIEYNQIVLTLIDLLTELKQGDFDNVNRRLGEIESYKYSWGKSIFQNSKSTNQDVAAWISKNEMEIAKGISEHISQKYNLQHKEAWEFKHEIRDGLILIAEALDLNQIELLDNPKFVFKTDRFNTALFIEAIDLLIHKIPHPPRIREESRKTCIQYLSFFRNQIVECQ